MNYSSQVPVLLCAEDAAKTEPAWQGVGKEVGLRIWRIVVHHLQHLHHYYYCTVNKYSLFKA